MIVRPSTIFWELPESHLEKKNHENPLISVEKHDKSMGPYELNEPSHYNYIK